jgi:hypothetical protein
VGFRPKGEGKQKDKVRPREKAKGNKANRERRLWGRRLKKGKREGCERSGGYRGKMGGGGGEWGKKGKGKGGRGVGKNKKKGNNK